MAEMDPKVAETDSKVTETDPKVTEMDPKVTEMDPKVKLLCHKLALLIGEEDCPVYNIIKDQYPTALEEPWTATMSEPYKYVGTQTMPNE